MRRLRAACIDADIMGFQPHEAVAYLINKGFGRLTESRYRDILKQVRAKDPSGKERLASVAASTMHAHADALQNIRLVTSHLWDGFWALPARKTINELEECEPAQKIRLLIVAEEARARQLERIASMQPLIGRYVELAGSITRSGPLADRISELSHPPREGAVPILDNGRRDDSVRASPRDVVHEPAPAPDGRITLETRVVG